MFSRRPRLDGAGLAPALLLVASCASPEDASRPGVEDVGEATSRGALLFSLPVLDRELISTPVMGVDHDPDVYDGVWRVVCADYMERGFPHCYDEHDGSDFILEGGFDAMDSGSATVAAALEGEVLQVEDGNYDRCHGDPSTFEVTCDGHPMVANSVVLEHEGGYRTMYWHLMKGSVAVEVGDRVEAGDFLGLVGSSGVSALPHLHFEVRDPDGLPLDPFAGPLSQPETWWCDQGDPEELPGHCS